MAAEPADVWTKSKNIQFIREFRKRPILWDQKNHMFYKTEFKKWAWVEVSKIVKMPVERCTRKIALLMSYFKKEAKLENSFKNSADPAKSYQSSWYLYEELSFLLDKDRERELHSTENTDDEKEKKLENTDDEKEKKLSISKKKSTTPVLHNTVENEDKKTFTPPAVHHKIENPKRLKPSLEKDDYEMIQPKKVKSTTPALHNTIEKIYMKTSTPPAVHHKIEHSKPLRPSLEKDDDDMILQPKKVADHTILKTYSRKLITTPPSGDDEIKFFSNFIASKMIKYSETTKNAAQKAICEVIFKADQNYYEPNVNEPVDPLHQPSRSVELPNSDFGFMKIYFSDSD